MNPKTRKTILSIAIPIVVLTVFVLGTVYTWFGTPSRMLKDLISVGLDYITFDHPLDKVSWKDIAEDCETANSTKTHPYVLVTASEFDTAKTEYYDEDGDAYIKERLGYAIEQAEAMLSEPYLVYELNEDDEMLEVSRAAVNRIMTLAGVYNITGDVRYAERCYNEIENVCSFDDWHTDHFLDTTEMAFAVSLGYDWLYNYLSDERKAMIAETVYEYAIKEANPATTKLKNWWLWSKVNWNTQCYGGIGVASMVFSEYYPKECAKFLSAAYYNMPLHFTRFSPDGAYVEGNSYWEAMSSYLLYFVTTSRNFLGTDYGLSEVNGFDKIGYFPLYISAPQGVFNFADNRNEPLYSPSLHWFAEEYDEPMLSYFQLMSNKENEYARESLLSSLWYNPDTDFSADALSQVSNSIYMRSDAYEEFVTMRSDYCDPNSTYVGIKGGYNYSNHGDLDIGSFVFDALGERWICDLGKSSYSLPGYFNGLPNGGRWRVYMKRAEGHNTLVINPDKANEDQYPFAAVKFSEFLPNDNGGVASLDMSDAYIRNGVKSVVRSVEMYNSYSCVRITDTVVCKKASDIWWFAHTAANIEISTDGKTATLSIVDETEVTKKVYVKIGSETDGVFQVMDSLPMLDDKRYDGAEAVEGVQKLAIHLSGVTEANIVVTFEPEYT